MVTMLVAGVISKSQTQFVVPGCLPNAKGVIPILHGFLPSFRALGKRDADFLQEGSCCAEDPLHGVRPLRIGLPARLP